MTPTTPFTPETYYSWRHDDGGGILTTPFDPRVDEINVYEQMFTTAEAATEFLLDYLDMSYIPHEYALVEITERPIPVPVILEETR